MTHVLITGPRGVGKTTLIQRVLKTLERPVRGFETKKEPALADPVRGEPLYIYTPGQPKRRTEENLLGWCRAGGPRVRPGAFDRFAGQLLRPVPAGGLLLFDELGFMESREEQFCRAVLARLDGDVPVIAAVKELDTPFLKTVRAHPKCRCFPITPENREALFPEVLAFLREQLADRRSGAGV